VRKWLSDHKDQIEVFYLPPYTPEHNPDEYLNRNLKVHPDLTFLPLLHLNFNAGTMVTEAWSATRSPEWLDNDLTNLV
jgi:hypothetical protein